MSDGDPQWYEPTRELEPAHAQAQPMMAPPPAPRPPSLLLRGGLALLLAVGTLIVILAWPASNNDRPAEVDPAAPTAEPAGADVDEPDGDIRTWRVVGESFLRVRAEPGTSGEVLGSLPPGSVAVATGRTSAVGSTTWREIRQGDLEGWVSGNVLEPVDG